MERLQQVAAALGNPAVDILLHWASAIVERVDGRFDAALQHLQLAIALGEQIGDRWFDGMARLSLAMASDAANPHAAFDDALTPPLRQPRLVQHLDCHRSPRPALDQDGAHRTGGDATRPSRSQEPPHR
jgi:hypothetical protein